MLQQHDTPWGEQGVDVAVAKQRVLCVCGVWGLIGVQVCGVCVGWLFGCLVVWLVCVSVCAGASSEEAGFEK